MNCRNIQGLLKCIVPDYIQQVIESVAADKTGGRLLFERLLPLVWAQPQLSFELPMILDEL